MNRLPLTLTAAVLTAASGPAMAGELFLLGLVPYSYAHAPSADGRVVVGYDQLSHWYWTRETWVVRLEESVPPGNGVGGVPSITADGNTIVCTTLQGPKPVKSEATFYDRKLNTYDPAIGSLGFNCDISRSSPWGMTPTASHVCGLVWDVGCAGKGYVWDAATDTMKILPTLYFFKPTRGNDISDDGGFVGGWNDDFTGYRQGCVWTRNAAGDYVGTLLNTGVATQKLREVGCVSGNGQWAFGQGRADIAGGAPYRWSAATGFQAITPTPVAGVGSVYQSNFDGSTLLCGISGSPYLWFAGRGYVSLAQWSKENGFDLTPDWSFIAFGMTEDALTITGYALRNSDLAWSPFVLDLRPTAQPCLPDLNGDGAVGAADIAILLGDWGAFGSSSDLDGDNVVGPADLAALLSAWGECP